jgi:hypothetical protein
MGWRSRAYLYRLRALPFVIEKRTKTIVKAYVRCFVCTFIPREWHVSSNAKVGEWTISASFHTSLARPSRLGLNGILEAARPT